MQYFDSRLDLSLSLTETFRGFLTLSYLTETEDLSFFLFHLPWRVNLRFSMVLLPRILSSRRKWCLSRSFPSLILRRPPRISVSTREICTTLAPSPSRSSTQILGLIQRNLMYCFLFVTVRLVGVDFVSCYVSQEPRELGSWNTRDSSVWSGVALMEMKGFLLQSSCQMILLLCVYFMVCQKDLSISIPSSISLDIVDLLFLYIILLNRVQSLVWKSEDIKRFIGYIPY